MEFARNAQLCADLFAYKKFSALLRECFFYALGQPKGKKERKKS